MDASDGRRPRGPALAVGAVLVLWPLVIWLALGAATPRAAAGIVLAGLVALGGFVVLAGLVHLDRSSASGGLLIAARPLAPAVALAALTAASGDPRFLLAQPVLVNLALGAAFGASLRAGSVPLLERFARRIAELPPGGAEHCRAFTWAWTAFALTNAGVSAWLALDGPLERWALWTGPGSYAAIGALLALEWVVRRRRFGPMPRRAGATIRRP